jgi:radical SAM protein with 4Fe4S-binding SPASM domain
MGAELPDDKHIRRLQKLDADSERTYALIDELLRMGTRQFLFTGSGEPFLHKNAIEFMGRVKHAGCTCIVNTNGTLLDRAMIDELIKMEFDELRITLMAGTPEMYARTHPGMRDETFDSLRDNLLYLAERKAALGLRKPTVSLVFIVVSQNYDGIFDFAKFATLLRTDLVLFRPVDDIEDPGLSKVVPAAEQAVSVKEQLIEAKAYLESQRVAHNISYFLKVSGEQLDTAALYRVIPCYYGWLSVRIDTDGLVYPCCRCYEPLGNMDEKKFHEVWNGSVYRRFRQEAMQIKRRKSPVSGCDCNSCPHYTANLRVYRILHPVKGRSARIEKLCPAFSEEGE